MPATSQTAHITLRGYDLQTGQTSTITELDATGGIFGLSESFGAVGTAGIVATSSDLASASDPTVPRRVRNELRRWDGTTAPLQEFDTSYQNPGYYEMQPVIVGQRVIYREPYTGAWSVYDSATQEASSISPF